SFSMANAAPVAGPVAPTATPTPKNGLNKKENLTKPHTPQPHLSIRSHLPSPPQHHHAHSKRTYHAAPVPPSPPLPIRDNSYTTSPPQYPKYLILLPDEPQS